MATLLSLSWSFLQIKKTLRTLGLQALGPTPESENKSYSPSHPLESERKGQQLVLLAPCWVLEMVPTLPRIKGQAEIFAQE